MNYTFHQLQVFVKICQAQSITKAAEELFLTQPAVSIQMKKFQEQFDMPLTELRGRRIYITDFGQEIFSVCLQILDKSELIESTALQYKGLLAGKLTISAASTGKYVLPYFLSDFVNAHPGINVSIDITNKSKVIQSIETLESEFALVSVLPSNLEVESEELMANRLYLVGKTSSKKDKMTSKDLSKIRLVFRESGSATRNAMEDYFISRGINPADKLELVSNEAVKQAVCAGLGHSIIPLIGMKGELELNKLKIIQAPGLPIETEWRLIHLKNKELSPVGKAFLEHVRINKMQIIEREFGTDLIAKQ